MGELYWIDLLDRCFVEHPCEGVIVFYRPLDGSYAGRGYYLGGKWYTIRHEEVADVRWWTYPSKTIEAGYPGLNDGATALQYSVAWGLIQEVINFVV